MGLYLGLAKLVAAIRDDADVVDAGVSHGVLGNAAHVGGVVGDAAVGQDLLGGLMGAAHGGRKWQQKSNRKDMFI